MILRWSTPSFVSVATAGLFAVVLVALLSLVPSSRVLAASTNPYGYVDYCSLEGTSTVLYGWAADPNASSLSDPHVILSVGGNSVNLPTDQNYRTSQINDYIIHYEPGDPEPGTYGFRAVYTNLYKGNTYYISGIISNIGPGANQIIKINSSSMDDDPSHVSIADQKTVPQACLTTPPTAPSPNPSATAKSHTPTATPKSSIVTPSSPAVVSSATLASGANATILTGSLAAQLTVPAGGALTLYIKYGTSPLSLGKISNQATITSTAGLITIAKLQPITRYSYQIVRTASNGSTTTSGIGSFTTKGFVVVLHFLHSTSIGVAGISGQMSALKLKSTSDSAGLMRFSPVPAGIYTVRYIYHGASYSEIIRANADAISSQAGAAVAEVPLNYFISVDHLTAAQTLTPKQSSNLHWWLLVITILLIVLLVLPIIIRRRKRTAANALVYNTEQADSFSPIVAVTVPQIPTVPSPVEPPTAGAVIDIVPQTAAIKFKQPPVIVPPPMQRAAYKPTDVPEHTGESLKAMVMRGMAEEARHYRPSGRGINPEDEAADRPFDQSK